MNPKYPGGIGKLTVKLSNEGHKVVQKGKCYFVADFEKRLVQLEKTAGS
jgi:hypothetical protein